MLVKDELPPVASDPENTSFGKVWNKKWLITEIRSVRTGTVT